MDSPKLNEFADDSLNFDENSRKFSKQIENTAGKGEIDRYAEFLLFPQCFQKACTVIGGAMDEYCNDVVMGATQETDEINVTWQINYEEFVLFLIHFISFLLTLSKTTNFRPFQTERVCRRKFQI